MAIEPFAGPVILIGALLVADLLLKALLRRVAIPSVVVHLALGFALSLSDWHSGWVGETSRAAVDLLGSVGLVFLLFRVGLESNVAKLVENLRGAAVVWIADVVVSGAIGYGFARYGLALDLVPALFVGVALTATSVGVSVSVWQEERALGSTRGQLLLDVAELDDISAILMMAVLFAVAPLLHGGDTGAIPSSIAWTTLDVLGRLALFGGACALFAHFAEEPLTKLIGRLQPAPDRLITVVSVGLVVAAAAGALGLSLAIGAFLAGLAFSRDPEAVKLDAYFDPLYDFFTPFFFIAIGLRVAPETLGATLPLGLLLFAVAAAGKLLGAGGGSLHLLGVRGGSLLGSSMIPRAEIAMVVMQYGTMLGSWAVPPHVFSAMVVVSLSSCLLPPLYIRGALRRDAGATMTPDPGC